MMPLLASILCCTPLYRSQTPRGECRPPILSGQDARKLIPRKGKTRSPELEQAEMVIFKKTVNQIVNQALKPFNFGIIRTSRLRRLEEENEKGNKAVHDLQLLLELPGRHSSQILEAGRGSKSQLGQDLFVLSCLDFKKNGFFVEFGAADGVEFSNTYLLEKEFGWSGILAEPAKRWHPELRKNRNSLIETDCVWGNSNSTLTFNEAPSGVLSTIDSFSSSDFHHKARIHGTRYSVKTISLQDLLDKHNAPPQIDYLSIDTEGSEYEILKNFNFDKYQFKVITCEHNYEPAREKIHELLTGKGYVRKFDNLSQFDDWFVKAE
jgi:FkbM family methyltransferase